MLPTQKTKDAPKAQGPEVSHVPKSNEDFAAPEKPTEDAPSAELQTTEPKSEGLSEIAVDNEEMFRSFESISDDALNEATSGYFTPEEGEVYNFITTGIEIADGFKDDDGNPKEQEVAVLYDKDKRKLISASAVLVNTVRQLFAKTDKKAIFIRVFCEGKEKIKGGGFYFKLKIKTL